MDQNPLKPLFADIANAIREKEDSTGSIPAETFPERIKALPSGGLPENVHTITVEASDPEGGSVSGGGMASEGMTVTVKAESAAEYDFSGWAENGQVVESQKVYTFSVSNTRILKALFSKFVKFEWGISDLPYDANFNGIAYGNGKFVAVSAVGYGAYSEDGIHWTGITLPVKLKSIAFGNGRFVAVSNSKQGYGSAYSEDGIVWHASNLAATIEWVDIAYGNGLFVTIGNNSRYFAYSTNGIDWNIIDFLWGYWNSIAFGNGVFVATGNGCAYSEDGIVWTQANLKSDVGWVSVSYGDGKFVAVSNSNSRLSACSENGADWITNEMPTLNDFANWSCVAYGEGRFVALDQNQYAYTRDGMNWVVEKLQEDLAAITWGDIDFSNGKFCAIGYGKSIYSIFPDSSV